MSARIPADAASLLPHGENARFVREVLDLGERTLTCSGRIPIGSPFAPGPTVPGFVLLELAAQAAAIELLIRMESGSRPRFGYLARARSMDWTAEPVPAGALLTTRVHREESTPPLYRFRASVALDDTEVFAGEFAVHINSVTA